MEVNVLSKFPVPPEHKSIPAFAEKLAALTQKLADELYYIDNFKDSPNAKFREWCEAAYKFLEDKVQPDFIFARYGYAVEEYVNLSLISKSIIPPRPYKIRLQVTHGSTRPDIVVLNEHNEEIAWMDITSKKSKGHILSKSGNWPSARSYVAELLYEDLDLSKITTVGGSIASHVAPRIMRAAKQMNSKLMRHLAEYMNISLRAVSLGDTIRERDFVRLSSIVEANFGIRFKPNLKHPIIHSMLMMYIGLPEIKCADEASKWLRAYSHEKPRQSKSEAMSYITDSFNKLERFAIIGEEDGSDNSDPSGDYIPDTEVSDGDELDFEAYCSELAVLGNQSDDLFDPDEFF